MGTKGRECYRSKVARGRVSTALLEWRDPPRGLPVRKVPPRPAVGFRRCRQAEGCRPLTSCPSPSGLIRGEEREKGAFS